MQGARDRKPAPATALRRVLAIAAPGASESDLGRFSEGLAVHALMLQIRLLMPTKRGTAPALKSLAGVNRRILALIRSLDEMGGDEELALDSLGAPSKFAMIETIADLNPHIVAAYKRLSTAETIPTRARGRSRDVITEDFVTYAARIFEKITGEAATFYYDREQGGPESAFGKYLVGVFRALAIDASAEHHARRVCERNRKTK